MKIQLCILAIFSTVFYLNVTAQKFPFDITALSSPQSVGSKRPIISVRSEPFQNREVYKFSTICVLQGVSFSNVFLDFEDGKLTKMTFPIKSNQDQQTVIKALSAKYKKESNSNYDTPYCYRNGDILIYFIKLDKIDVTNNYGYLYYEYQAASSF